MTERIYRIVLSKDEVQPITVPMFAKFHCAHRPDDQNVELFYLGDEDHEPSDHVIQQIEEVGELKHSLFNIYLGSAIGLCKGARIPTHIFELN